MEEEATVRTDGEVPRIVVERRPLVACCALWIRTAEGLQPPVDPLVPGPLSLDPCPEPLPGGPDRGVLALQWAGWWRSLVSEAAAPPHPQEETAHDTLDPLGLAGRPELADLVRRRGEEALAWHASGPAEDQNTFTAADLINPPLPADTVHHVFDLHLTLLPVDDTAIREVAPCHRYLVPEQLWGTPAFAAWLRKLLT